MEEQQDPTEPTELGQILEDIMEREETTPATKEPRFANPDITYLVGKYQLDSKVVGSALRSFGEAVVLESLRRFSNGWQYPNKDREKVFFAICRAVESVGKD
jgi:hypothetical protein